MEDVIDCIDYLGEMFEFLAPRNGCVLRSSNLTQENVQDEVDKLRGLAENYAALGGLVRMYERLCRVYLRGPVLTQELRDEACAAVDDTDEELAKWKS